MLKSFAVQFYIILSKPVSIWDLVDLFKNVTLFDFNVKLGVDRRNDIALILWFKNLDEVLEYRTETLYHTVLYNSVGIVLLKLNYQNAQNLTEVWSVQDFV